MILEAWFTASLIVGMLAMLTFTRAAPDLVFVGAVVILLLAGIVSPREAFAGFSNEGVITVAALYVVVAGLRETGGIQWIVQSLLGRPRSLWRAQMRLTTPVAVMSAFLNNTPVVGMLIPAVNEWARKLDLPVSRLMMPLSFAAILGGTITVIGTSTNLVVNGLLIDQTGTGLGLFDIAWVGVPVAFLGLGVMLVFGRYLFPDRRPPMSHIDDPREYTLEMLVEDDGPLVGRSIEEAGLRHLPGGYLMELDRQGTLIPAVSPQEMLRAGDRLIFVGVVESMADLQRIRGLTPATGQVFKLDGRRSDRVLLEVVVSNTCPVVGMTIRDGGFRNRYNAVVIAVARNGERLRGKIGDIVLRPGDTLLVEAGSSFLAQNRNRRDFFLMTQVQDSATPRHDRALVAMGILVAMVGSASLGLLSMLEAALAAAGLMILSGCVSMFTARGSLDWSVLLTIAAAFGVAAAMNNTGLAQAVALNVTGLAGDQPWLNLLLIYLLTALFTALITNNAAAVLMFPIAWAVAQDLGVSLMPFAVAIMFAASASFATPFGYQTNLMVYGPGGYRFSDYLRAGIPMTLVTGALVILLVPLIWSW
ncbi:MULTISPECIES: SLC13 family permease [Ectothiorhodospira]|uniref:SLC13 family permease n=1 Tax=Ectothiorhodospira TaxID=1051 RepID=UPI001EE89AA3|nr:MULTISPECIES: SLC13 family permease [Ectothiorhodospira]MCG5495085.1 SLC13 family permease [Ectothiorhodospira variabilis]MCG5498626.1 SLC13 family permease [Ectothiorhodospira variabilis]MCG5504672.1 SLC13 family permease [Ectothiorhodospira variabilis]MCG5507775.1 SLC13 family permease [Ectothiorhodospira variabilis]MCG5525699.1 SLC13 family permease [Ectothiorhodospira haloalkaliphila]